MIVTLFLKKILKDNSAVLSLFIIVCVGLLGLLGPLFFPKYDSPLPYSQLQHSSFQNAPASFFSERLLVLPNESPWQDPAPLHSLARPLSTVTHAAQTGGRMSNRGLWTHGEPTADGGVPLRWELNCTACTHVLLYRNEWPSLGAQQTQLKKALATHVGARGIPLATLPVSAHGYLDELALEQNKSYIYVIVPVAFPSDESQDSQSMEALEPIEDTQHMASVVVPLKPAIRQKFAQFYLSNLDSSQKKSVPPVGSFLSGPVFLFGTDALGRDVFARVIEGTRVAYAIALTAPFMCIVIGLGVGLVAGLWGGWVDLCLMRFIEIFEGIPELLVLILLQLVIGQGVFSVIVTLSLFSWLGFARLVRAEVFKFKNQDFVSASRALGASSFRIAIRHVAPQLTSSIVVVWSNMIPRFIAAESFLSFIGLGIQAPQASWGHVLLEAGERIQVSFLGFLYPALFVGVTFLAFFTLGDRLRDILDPRLRGL